MIQHKTGSSNAVGEGQDDGMGISDSDPPTVRLSTRNLLCRQREGADLILIFSGDMAP